MREESRMTETPAREATIAAIDAAGIAGDWLAAFEAAAGQGDITGVLALFAEDCWWRDWLAVTWDLRTLRGPDAIKAAAGDRLAATGFRALTLRSQIPARIDDEGIITAGLNFKTNVAAGRGMVRLREQDGTWKAWTLFTKVDDLIDYPERRMTLDEGCDHPQPADRGDRETWYEYRARKSDFADRQPDVLVVGAGHAGLTTTARLEHLGLSTLLVEQTTRVGDVWRQRYNNLSLHDSKWFGQMPYLPFPDSWPAFSPKEMIADWFESYAWMLQLNVWTSTQVISAAYDEVSGRWTVELSRDGAPRVVRPRQLVFATGAHGGHPQPPALPGRESFAGTVVHSSSHQGGAALEGKRVITVGVGSSGIDVAEDAYLNGAAVTIVQRSPTCVVSTTNGVRGSGALYGESSPPVDDADLMFNSYPVHLFLKEVMPPMVRRTAQLDAEMLAGLNRAGLRTTLGPGDSGIIGQSWVRGGYYIDKGATQLIIDGKIKIQPGEITSFTPDGVIFSDGSSAPADVVVFAIGFPNMRDAIRPIIGDELADTLSPVWYLDDEGEIRGVFRPSGHPKLWFAGGGFVHSRWGSKLLAMQIKASEEGISSH
jgi:cation diffusion facilitator CzcD-associated flavoprotein CzcO